MATILLSGSDWGDIYALSGITVGTAITIQVQSGAPMLFKDAATKPSLMNPSGIKKKDGETLSFNATATGAWVLPLNGNGSIEVLPAYSKMSLSDGSSRAILYGSTLDRVATQALNYRDDAVARGLGYYAYNNQAIPAASKTWARFACPSDKYVVLLGRQIVTDNTKLFYRAYNAWTGGTVGSAITIRNLRTDTAYPATSTINYITGTPTPTAGADVTNLPIYGSESVGNRVGGGTDSVDTFRLLAPSTSFLIEWENASATTMNVFTQFTWFELSTQVIL